MAEVTVGGIRFHVQQLPAHRVTGSAENPTHPPIVVFVHGLVVDNMSSHYYILANPAARAGAEVILYDLRGHGATERPPTGYSLEESVRDLTGLLDEMGVTRPVRVVGNSFGGTIALALAMAHPDRVASLLLIDAVVTTEEWIAQTAYVFEQAADGLAKNVKHGKDLSDWRAEQGRKNYHFFATIDALVNGTTLAADLRAMQPFSSASLRSVACPVVAAYGEDSDIIDHAYTLKRLLPSCDLTVVPNCTHFLLSEAPDVVRDLLLRQLTSDAVTKGIPIEKAPAR